MDAEMAAADEAKEAAADEQLARENAATPRHRLAMATPGRLPSSTSGRGSSARGGATPRRTPARFGL
jgi:hypothetical protein